MHRTTNTVAVAANHNTSGFWPRWIAMVLVLAMVLSLMVAAPAAASGATFTLDSWTRDADDETLASYETTLTVPAGVGCGQTYSTRCEFTLTARYADAYIDRSQGTLVSTSALAGAGGPSVYEFDYVNRSLAPVTYLRAVLHPVDGSPDTVWEIPVADSFVYPAPDPSVELVQFVRDPDDETLAGFRFDLDFLGMGSPGAPCWNHDTTTHKCRYKIRLEHRSVENTKLQYQYDGAVYADDDLGQISPTATHQVNTTVGPVTHAVVKIYGELTGPGSIEDPYVWEIPIGDSFLYPAPDPSVELVQFVRDPDNQTLAGFRFDLDFLGMGSPGAPCWNHDTTILQCHYTIRLEHRSVDSTELRYQYGAWVHADDDLGQISPTATHQVTTTVGPVTHAVVKIYGELTGPGSIEDPYIWEIPIADPAAIWPTASTSIDDAAAQRDGLDEAIAEGIGAHAITAAADMDPATLTLVIAGLPCPRNSASGSLNDCNVALETMKASGASTKEALAALVELFGMAIIDSLIDAVIPPPGPDGRPVLPPELPPVPDDDGDGAPDDLPQTSAEDLGESFDEFTSYFVAFLNHAGYTLADLDQKLCSYVQADGIGYGRETAAFCAKLRLQIQYGNLQDLQDAAQLAYTTINRNDRLFFLTHATRAQYRDLLLAEADGGSGSGRPPRAAPGGHCDDGAVPDDQSAGLDISSQGMTDAARADLLDYARLTNSHLAKTGPLTGVSTTEALSQAGGTFAKGARDAWEELQVPVGDKVFGHVPDSTISARAEPPCGWLLMEEEANRAAGNAAKQRVGTRISHLTVDGVLPHLHPAYIAGSGGLGLIG